MPQPDHAHRDRALPDLAFGSAGLADVPALVALIQSAYRGDESRRGWTTEADLVHGQRTGPGEVAAIVGSTSGLMLMAHRAGVLVGCCQLVRRAEATAYLGMLAVRPHIQGGGIGTALVRECERVARLEWRARRMTLQVISVRHELIAWYLRLGYRPSGRTLPFPRDVPGDVPQRPDLRFAVLEKELA